MLAQKPQVLSLEAPERLVKFNKAIKSPMMTYAWEIYFLGVISLIYFRVPEISRRVVSLQMPPWGFSEMKVPNYDWAITVPGHHLFGDGLTMEFIEDSDLKTFQFLSLWTRLVGLRELGNLFDTVLPIPFVPLPLFKSILLVTMYTPSNEGTALGRRNRLFAGVYPTLISEPRLDVKNHNVYTYSVKFVSDFYVDLSDITSFVGNGR